MKTANINGVRKSITYKCHSGISTYLLNPVSKNAGLFGADIYTVDDDDVIVLVATSGNTGSTLRATTKVISKDEYSFISYLHDPYNGTAYHDAIMSELGFK